METNAATATTPTPQTTKSRTQIADKFDDFLLLLTTQLENQDPLNPLDSTEFVTQLVSFTEVEQSINTNTHLERLVAMLDASQRSAAVGYLGTTVEAEGDKAMLRDGTAQYTYELPRKAATGSMTITNAKGQIVFSGTAETSVGSHEFNWDGRDMNGIPQPDGLYQITVKAKDATGTDIPVSTTIFGRVIGIDQSGDGIFLDVDGNKVPLASILAVRDSATSGDDS